jgi:signal transduction histidine kinase
VGVPIRPGTDRQGAVAVTVSLAGIRRLARTAGLIALAGGAIGVVAITLLIHLQVRRLVLRPLLDIAGVMDVARSGQLAARVRVHRPDELGSVATGLNQMLAELDELHRSLNERVEAATSALRERNQELVVSYERVTELRETVARAQQLAAVGQTLANVAHQVGTPLNLVSGHVQLMKSTVEDPELQRRLRIVEEQIARVVDVVRTLLDRAHPRAIRHPVHIDSVLARMAEAIRGQLATRHISLTVRPSGGRGTVTADESQLELALLNLVTNAVDAMPGGGSLVLEATEDERTVRVHVRDSGTGISDDVRARLFEPWVTTKAPGRGSGLGLSITRDLVTTLGGSIEVERSDTSGTSFVVELPISREPV